VPRTQWVPWGNAYFRIPRDLMIDS
jgi:hypothetical protein